MKILSSLRSRIFLASALLAVVCISVAIYLVNARVTQEAERTLEREIVATAALFDSLRTARTETFVQMARLIADAPPLKAAVDTDDPATVQPKADEYQNQLKSSFLLVTNRHGRVLASVGAPPRTAEIVSTQPAIRDALAGRESSSLLPQPDGMIQLVTVPLFVLTNRRPDIFGTVSVGFKLDTALASELKTIMGSDIAFGMDGQILAATLPREYYPLLAERLRSNGISRLILGDAEYEALPRPLSTPSGSSKPPTPALTVSNEAATVSSGPVVLVLRSRTEQLKSLHAIHTGLVATAIVAVLVATALSFGVARTIARPLAAITDVMREVAATGDLTRKIALRHRNRWDDDDARLLANTFNTLTDSIARFQRDMSHKERLTALGRLSTVIAHEVRNPLMIIKVSLHALGRPDADPATVREAVHDIDEEVERLNRIVNEVLDFARPIQFEVAPVDINALCSSAATAAQASGPGPDIALELDPSLGTITTDAERLRMALVNVLVNARHAVNGDGAAVRLSVAFRSEAAGDRVRLVVRDRGAGISADVLGQVFDPYFTTKRGGTGLGLPIAKNVIEGLGGTIVITSAPGRGTEIRIDLPVDSTAGRPATLRS